MNEQKKKEILSQLTLEEKASLCSGADFWHTKEVKRLGIPAVTVSDGPHGLRQEDPKDHNKSYPAVCFPSACATACSFDRHLLFELGEILGSECRSQGVSVILGPAVNIKRTPLCGRNFEYFSEDPLLAGELAAAYIQGVQSQKVGTSIKHFCANNQEERRMTVSAEVDERTLREIYLTAFELAVKKAKPWTVMCSYNRINGEYASENKKLLTDILRKEWGFKGLVMSDWGAVNDRVKGVAAGLDLEMPSSGGVNDSEIVRAVRSGVLKESDLDQAVENVLELADRHLVQVPEDHCHDWDADHEFARQVECESMVLLKNEDEILPLNRQDKIAFIGKFAETPRYQGGGSSHINAYRVTSAMEAVQQVTEVTYVHGFTIDDDQQDEALLQEAVRAAAQAKVAVIFAGLPEYIESEGFDRKDMKLPECQNRLIHEVAKVQPNTVVVLHNGAPVEMPWVNEVKGLLELYLGGEAVGAAAVDVLFGFSNPCGKLAETIPVKLSDNPSYLFYSGEGDTVEYREGIFVGYRYYEKKGIPVQFPFGYGLSYTTFQYSDLEVNHSEINENGSLSVTLKVRNTGKRAGKEIVQLYVKDHQSAVIRPVKELKGFEKIELNPGEAKIVGFQLDRRAFAYYSEELQDWCVQDGTYEILIGKSSRDIELSTTVRIKSASKARRPLTVNSTLGEFLACHPSEEILGTLKRIFPNLEDPTGIRDLPLRTAISFSNGLVTHEMLSKLINQVNSNVN